MGKDILSIFCPSCGAPAEFDIVNQFYRCSYCSGTVGLEAARAQKMQHQQKIRDRVRLDAKKYPLMTTSCTGNALFCKESPPLFLRHKKKRIADRISF